MKLANGTTVIAKPYQDEAAEEIVHLIIRNFKEINVKDYGEKAMEALTATHDVKWFKGVTMHLHVYVFWNEGKIVGVGSISSFFGGSPTESILLTIFMLPEFHRQGIGIYIIDTLESDSLFLRTERIEIPASITAVEPYRKKGIELLRANGFASFLKMRYNS